MTTIYICAKIGEFPVMFMKYIFEKGGIKGKIVDGTIVFVSFLWKLFVTRIQKQLKSFFK